MTFTLTKSLGRRGGGGGLGAELEIRKRRKRRMRKRRPGLRPRLELRTGRNNHAVAGGILKRMGVISSMILGRGYRSVRGSLELNLLGYGASIRKLEGYNGVH